MEPSAGTTAMSAAAAISRLTGVVLCVALLAGLAACGGEEKPEDRTSPAPGPRLTAQIARELDARFRRVVADTGVPGASAAIVFPDGRTWTRAAGRAVIEPETPMTTRTTLPFGSVTKTATAVLALRLAEEGRLRLDDPIRRWYPAWNGNADATVRDLLGHTAGTREDPPGPFWERLDGHPGRRVTPDQVIAAAPRPGPRTTTMEYSNTGYLIVGKILERAAGEPVAVAMRREVFGGPGGEGLALQPDEIAHRPRAESYVLPGGAQLEAFGDGTQFLPSRQFTGLASTAGALAGDVPSLARWGHELFTGSLLSAASRREMTRFRPEDSWIRYGLGLARDSVDGHDLWGHNGDMPGAWTELWHLPAERVTVAVAWNDDLIGREGGILQALLRAGVP